MIKAGKEVLVVLVVALAVFIAGCQGGTGPVVSSSTPFIGGTEGLRVGFLENAPPSEILDKGQTLFDIILKVENVGEVDVNYVKTTIGGLYTADFVSSASKPSTLQSVLNRPIQGVKKDPEGGKIAGGIDEITFLELSYTKTLEGNTEFPIQADTCYTYQTRAVGDYCMRQDLTKVTAGVCNVKGPKPVFNSGGPVQVVSLDESVGGKNTIILNFRIRTVGSGTFYKPTPGAAPSCTKGSLQSENFVRVTVDSGITGTLRCSGWGEGVKKKDVRLVNGEASVTCILGGIDVDALQKVNIRLDYNHLISTSTKLLVKHLPGDTGAAPPLGGQVPPPPPMPGQPGATLTWQDYIDKCTYTGGTWAGPNKDPPCNCGTGKAWKSYTDGCTRVAECTPGLGGRPVDCPDAATTGLNVHQNCPGTKTCTDNGQWSVCTDKPNDFCPVTSANIDEVKRRCEDTTASKGEWRSDLFKCVCSSEMPNYQYETGRCDAE